MDSETGEVILSGMGELHLEIIMDRAKREHNLEMIYISAPGSIPGDDHEDRQRRSASISSSPAAEASTAMWSSR